MSASTPELARAAPPGAGPVLVLERRRWARQAFFFDVLAVAALLLSALALGLDLYVAGYARATAGPTANPSFRPLARLGLEMVAFAASFTWLTARAIAAGYRALPGSR